MDNWKFILDLPIGFKSIWYSGSVWPAFTAVLLQFLTDFGIFLFFFYSLELGVWGWREGSTYWTHESISSSVLDYLTVALDNASAVIKLLPGTWDNVKSNLNRCMRSRRNLGDISSKFFLTKDWNQRLAIGCYMELLSDKVICQSLTSPGCGKGLFFNLGVSPFGWRKVPKIWRPLVSSFNPAVSGSSLPPSHTKMHQLTK